MVLNLFRQVVAFIEANPAYAGLLSWAAAASFDWLFGVAIAIKNHQFSWDKLPQILKSQLATTEAIAIGSLVLSAALTSVATGNPSFKHIVTLLLGAAAVAATGYSVPTWRDVILKIRDLAGLANA